MGTGLAPPTSMKKTKSFLMLGLLALALSAPARAADTRGQNSAPSSAELSMPKVGSVPQGTSLGSRAEEQRYAAREAASPEAKKYRGGDVVVISVTTLVIILLIVVIIILI
jgi:hypothetical protein